MARTTKAQYLALMEHAIHAESPATGVVLETVLNQAGGILFDEKPWPWAIKGPVTLAFEADTNEIELPADFGGVVSCVAQSNFVQTVQFVSSDVIQIVRNNTAATANLNYLVCVQPWNGQVTPGVSPRAKLLLDRTTSTAGTPTFELTYTRDFPELADDNAVADMPASMDWALVCLSRAMAWGLENDQEHPDMARYRAHVEKQWDKFRTQQPNLGPVRGGAGDRVRRGYTSADRARFRI